MKIRTNSLIIIVQSAIFITKYIYGVFHLKLFLGSFDYNKKYRFIYFIRHLYDLIIVFHVNAYFIRREIQNPDYVNY
jgi:hypothetical protein